MLERLLFTIVLIMLSAAAFRLARWSHGRSVGRRIVGTGQPRLLYFRSDRCAGCATQARVLSSLEGALTDGVRIERIDVEAEPDRAAAYGVFTLPTTLLVDGSGHVRHINYGLTEADRLARQLEEIA